YVPLFPPTGRSHLEYAGNQESEVRFPCSRQFMGAAILDSLDQSERGAQGARGLLWPPDRENREYPGNLSHLRKSGNMLRIS
ncbi:hypothetical protein J6590_108071, partial [Homalodisca vitripennis]